MQLVINPLLDVTFHPYGVLRNEGRPFTKAEAPRNISSVEGPTGWNGQGQADGGTEDERHFHVVLRGYDRLEVDSRLEYLESQLVAASRSLQEAQERNAELAAQLRSAQQQPHEPSEPVMPQESFGFRVERILRLAEEEAKGVRTQAESEAMELVEQARAQAQAMRDEAEQLRSAAEHEAEQLRVTIRHETEQLRMTALREAQALRATVEQETEQRRTSADELRTTIAREAEQLRSAAQQDAERIRADAESRAKALLASADKIAMDEREHAEQETQRLSALHDEIWADLTRIRDILGGVLAKNGTATTEVGAPEA
jgi:cell division septum initiation protein DivIVA